MIYYLCVKEIYINNLKIMKTTKQIKEMQTMDIYNILMDKENDSEFRLMAEELKNRNETELLYSLLINR